MTLLLLRISDSDSCRPFFSKLTEIVREEARDNRRSRKASEIPLSCDFRSGQHLYNHGLSKAAPPLCGGLEEKNKKQRRGA